MHRFFFVFVALLVVCFRCVAADARPVADDPQLEARMLRITTDLRCLVCQNQTITDSHSGLATDLRLQVRELLQQGKSDEEIRAYMTKRYGDFILYKPPLKATTLALWIGPAGILLVGLIGLFVHLRRRQRISPDAFDPDPQVNEHAQT